MSLVRDGFTRAESGLLTIGIALLVLYASMRLDALAHGARDLAFIHEAVADTSVPGTAAPDTALWSASRIAAYRASADVPSDALAGALAIPSLDFEAPLYVDAGELYLNRGLGLIEGTDPPGPVGNIGVAGHRDGYFRALKDIEVGAAIELLTRNHVYTYRVTDVFVVEPEDASLLKRTAEPVITLVTCYPFYFVGPAPQRFVVRGTLVKSGPRAAPQFHPQANERRRT